MTLDEFESISIIAASWFGILFALQQFVKSRTEPATAPSEASQSEEIYKSKYTIYYYLRQIKLYALVIFFFILALINFVTNNKTPTTLDVISISACTGAIIFMLTGCAYKYVIWKTLKSFDNGIEY